MIKVKMKLVLYSLIFSVFTFGAENSCMSSDGEGYVDILWCLINLFLLNVTLSLVLTEKFAAGTEECIFPFHYEGFTYYSCTWRGNTGTKGRPWCSKEGRLRIKTFL